MRIIFVNSYYSVGMGYSENCLPKALSQLGHDVHVVTSNLNVYGNLDLYDKTYKSFLGPADAGVGRFEIDGYTVHRLKSKVLFGYVFLEELTNKIIELSPDIIHLSEIASLQTFLLPVLRFFLKFKIFAENHQHISVVKSFMKGGKKGRAKRLIYKLTRTLPISLISLFVEKCYAISPDSAHVANLCYGVPNKKIVIQPLGTDTSLFKPFNLTNELNERAELRGRMGYNDDDIICIYTGRFSEEKNPLLLAKAINELALTSNKFKGLFIGGGDQFKEIISCVNTTILPFMKHQDLANYYRLADIAVWPTQESMSMLDAASSGLPLIVSDKMGDYDRIDGNGISFIEGNVGSLVNTLKKFSDKSFRKKLGRFGREKMEKNYSWLNVAKKVELDYMKALDN